MNNILKILFFISILSCTYTVQDRYILEITEPIEGVHIMLIKNL